MNRRFISALCMLVLILSSALSASADFTFEDDRFRGDFTTENLNAIIDEYELYDGWFWTTPADVDQDFHGHEYCPGWTYTAVKYLKKTNYLEDWYGCRWMINRVRSVRPDQGGYGECFGFAQFIGYLLSGEKNPQGHWKFYYNIKASQGLRVGDIVRAEYKRRGKKYQHSAVVYKVTEDRISFLQVSSGAFNQISVDTGYSDGNFINLSTLEDIGDLPYLKISRSQMNLQDKPADE